MAKLGDKTKLTKKTRKRKHNAAGDSVQIVSESTTLIENPSDCDDALDRTCNADEEVLTPAKHIKVSKKIGKSKVKRLKSPAIEEVPAEIEQLDDENSCVEPTIEQLRESEKPENVNAVQTVRQKKREKHQQHLQSQREHLNDKEKQRNQEYLRKWKHERSEWKFEKLRQISIQKNMLDDDKIDEEFWPIALEYLSGSKGVAKQKIIEATEAAIQELDDQCAGHKDQQANMILSSKYKRARELLQSLS